MKILYDYQGFANQSHGGVSRYFHGLMEHVAASDGAEATLGIKHTSNHHLQGPSKHLAQIPGSPAGPTIDQLLGPRRFRGRGRLFKLYETFRPPVDADAENREYSISLLRSGNYDVFHPTYYDPYFLEYAGDRPIVVTVFDMIHEIFPEHFALDNPARGWKRQLLARANAIVAISENTKRDILRFTDVSASRISVVPLGSNLDATKSGVPGLDLPKRFILYVGNRGTYKNFYFLVESFARSRAADIQLVCMGSYPFSAEEKAFFAEQGVSGRVVHVPATDDILVEGYKRALAFVFPSLYEGFGIPLIEAFACGCPVLCTNASAFPEVAGDAALFFEPKDVVGLTEAIDRIIEDRALAKQLIDAGRDIASVHTLERTAQLTMRAYQSAMEAT